jgi:hypothetical protein
MSVVLCKHKRDSDGAQCVLNKNHDSSHAYAVRPPDPARALLKRILVDLSYVYFREKELSEDKLETVRLSTLTLDGTLYDFTDEEVAVIKELTK